MPTRHGSSPDGAVDPVDADGPGHVGDPVDAEDPDDPRHPGALAAARPLPGRPPAHWTSPPPLTRWFVDPAADKIAAARSTAQPLT
jgi:hypothetical protein